MIDYLKDGNIEPKPDSWYSDGLRFECQHCGSCCRISGTVRLSHSDVERIRGYLGYDEETFRKAFLAKVDGCISLSENEDDECIMLDCRTHRCRIYAVRPIQCSTFPFWPELLRNKHFWDRESIRCPGMNKGRMWALDEIKERMLKSDG
jgi:uncharacterized protein